MSVRLLHVADVHLGAPLGNFEGYAERRRQDVEAAFRRTIDAALAERVHAVLLAGDLFDSHRPAARVVDLARRELARLREAGIPVLAVPGTHDSLLQPDCVYRREDLPIDRLFDAPTFDEIYRTNLRAAMFLAQAVARRQKRGGKQLHLLSVRAQLGLRGRGYSAYCATKGGLVMLIRQHAAELGRRGICVNGIAPTVVRTRMGAHWLKNPKTRAWLKERIPLGRVGRPDDVVNAAVFLASDEASWITGVNLVVDGGGSVLG